MTKPGLVQYVQYSCTHMATMCVKGLYTLCSEEKKHPLTFSFLSS